MAEFYEIRVADPALFGIWQDGTRYANFTLKWSEYRYGPPANNPHGTPDYRRTVESDIVTFDGSVESLSFEIDERWLLMPEALLKKLGPAAISSHEYPGMITAAMKLKSTGSDQYAIRETLDWNEGGSNEGLYRRGRRLTNAQAAVTEETNVPGQGPRYTIQVTRDGKTSYARGVSREEVISGQWTMYSPIPVRLFHPLEAGMTLGAMWREKQARDAASAQESTGTE